MNKTLLYLFIFYIFSLFSYLVYLNNEAQSITITDCVFNFGKCFTKTLCSNRYNANKNIFFLHKILLRIQCCHYKCQNRKKKSSLSKLPD